MGEDAAGYFVWRIDVIVYANWTTIYERKGELNMDRKNKYKLIAMAGVCAACIMVPASLAFSDYADDLLVDSYYNDILDVVSGQDTVIESDDDILLEDDIYIEDTVVTDDDILVSDVVSDEDDIVVVDNGYEADEIEVVDTVTYDPSLVDEDILITQPVITTPTPTPKPADSKTVKAAMSDVTGRKVSSSPAEDPAAAAEAVINGINEIRKSNGVAPLNKDTILNYVANQRAKETTQSFSHIRPNGKESVTILSDYNVDVSRSGENIACCIASPEGVVSTWANSPSHNKCMLNSAYTNAGVGCVESDGVTYWVLILTN